MFGDGRPHTGCLILPSDEGAPLAAESARKFLEAIWPVIEEANSHAPTHSRILKDMVAFLKYGTEIPVATKMSILRPACYSKFAKHIDYVYEKFEKGGSNKAKTKVTYTSQKEIEQFLLGKAGRFFAGGSRQYALTEDSDLHEMGVTSLQGAQLRNEILKEYDLEGATLGTNVVYELPTIKQLAAHVVALATGQTRALDEEETPEAAESAHKMMLAMVEYWSSMIKKPKAYVPPKQGRVDPYQALPRTIILTGASGALGAHLFCLLKKLFPQHNLVCFMRSGGEDAMRDSLRLRGLSHENIGGRFIAVDYAKPDFGINSTDYNYLAASVELILHCAWPVNFSMTLPSYEQQIAALVNLINLGTQGNRRSPPPAFVYISSISTVAGLPADAVVPADFPASPELAAPMGYGRSKWVAEHLVREAGRNQPAAVMRVGQLTGDTTWGLWNYTEAWPLLFRSSETLRALPVLEEQPQWLPVDQAAGIIAELASSLVHTQRGKTGAAVFNVVNPHAGKWDDVLTGLEEAGATFIRVSPEFWLKQLAESDTDLEKNPTRKLLKYYQKRFGAGAKPRKPVKFDCRTVERISPTYARLKPLDAAQAERLMQSLMCFKWDPSNIPENLVGEHYVPNYRPT